MGTNVPVRRLNLHEYQSKHLMAEHGIAVQSFKVAQTADQAREAAYSLGA